MGFEPVLSKIKPVPTPSMRSIPINRLLSPPPPQSGFNWIYIQTGKNPVLSQVGCGSREPQINLKESKKLKKLFHFCFPPMTKEIFGFSFYVKASYETKNKKTYQDCN